MGNNSSSNWNKLNNLPVLEHRNVVAINYNQFLLISTEDNSIYTYDCLNDKTSPYINIASYKLKYGHISSFYHKQTNTLYILNYKYNKNPKRTKLFAFNLTTKITKLFKGKIDCGEQHIIGTLVNNKYHIITTTSNNMIDFWLDEQNSVAHYLVLDLDTLNHESRTFDALKEEVRNVCFTGGHDFGMAYSEFKQSIYVFGNSFTFKGNPSKHIIYSEINSAKTLLNVDPIEPRPKLSVKIRRNNVVSCSNGEYFLFFNTCAYSKKALGSIYIFDLKKNGYKKSKVKCPFEKNEIVSIEAIDVLIMTHSVLKVTNGFIRMYSEKQFGDDIMALINRMAAVEYVHFLQRLGRNDDHTKHWCISIQALLG